MSQADESAGPLKRIVSLHTPGPWEVIERKDGTLEIGAGHNCTVARVLVPPVGDRRANAALLAASRDILDAARSVLCVFAHYPFHSISLHALADAVAKADEVQSNAALSGGGTKDQQTGGNVSPPSA